MRASNVVQISLDAGSTWTYTVIWKDAAGVPKSLSGYLARFQARKKAGAETELSLDESDGITISASDGRPAPSAGVIGHLVTFDYGWA